jgi:peptidoglycan/xylan/chitin deacetylase (PgdA/CDA1 family)
MKAFAQEKKVPILMYHSISSVATARFRQFTVSPGLFAEHIAYLHQQRYTPVTVTQFIRARSQGASALAERPVILTFDDGFADFFTDALPVLKQYNFTATLYITTAFIDGVSRWMRRERETTRRMLNRQQVREIAMNGIECGAHTHTHPQLDTLSAGAARNEMARSKELLEDHLGQEVCSFAYPYGYQTTRVRQLAREIGFTSACAVKHAKSSITDDAFSLARLMVPGGASLDTFAALLAPDAASPLTAARAIYLRARTPAWQLLRRSSVPLARYLQRRVSTL